VTVTVVHEAMEMRTYLRSARSLPVALKRGITICAVLTLVTTALLAGSMLRAATAVGLGTAGSYAVLAGETVTNTGDTVVDGDIGVHPGTAVTGFPPGTANGTIHRGDTAAGRAKDDLTTAYNALVGQECDATLTSPGDLGGQTLTPGVYCASSSIGLTGTLTLDAQGDPDAVFVFRIGSTLTTAPASAVLLTNGADACNVFWQIGSSATLGTTSDFVGNILALTSITLTTGADVDGRVLARNGSVTLDDNTIGGCSSPPTPTPTPVPTAEPTATPTAEPTATPTAEPTATPTAEPTATPTTAPTASPTPIGGLPLPTLLATPTPSPTPSPTTSPTPAPTAPATSTSGPTPAATSSAAAPQPTPTTSVFPLLNDTSSPSPTGLVALGEGGDERGLPRTGIPVGALVLIGLGLVVVGEFLRRSVRA
jgi:cell division septation protein DedD